MVLLQILVVIPMEIVFAAWNWKANGAGSTNTDGNNPNTVTVSANTTAGFSIIKYQGTDTGGQTIGHGLG